MDSPITAGSESRETSNYSAILALFLIMRNPQLRNFQFKAQTYDGLGRPTSIGVFR